MFIQMNVTSFIGFALHFAVSAVVISVLFAGLAAYH